MTVELHVSECTEDDSSNSFGLVSTRVTVVWGQKRGLLDAEAGVVGNWDKFCSALYYFISSTHLGLFF